MPDDKATEPWWKTAPGILTGLAALVTAVGGLLAIMNQTGLLAKPGGPAAPAPAAPSLADRTPAAKPEAAPVALPAAVPGAVPASQAFAIKSADLLASLKRANLGNSVGDDRMLEWLDAPDLRYRKLARSALGVLNGRALGRDGADLDKVNYLYVRSLGLPDGADMPAGHTVKPELLTAALVDAYNDKNGTRARFLKDTFGQP